MHALPVCHSIDPGDRRPKGSGDRPRSGGGAPDRPIVEFGRLARVGRRYRQVAILYQRGPEGVPQPAAQIAGGRRAGPGDPLGWAEDTTPFGLRSVSIREASSGPSSGLAKIKFLDGSNTA